MSLPRASWFYAFTFTGFSKPLHIMANVRLLFFGTKQSGTGSRSIECFINEFEEILIKIDIEKDLSVFVSLDKSTAIKFAKTLRSNINKMEVSDGNF